MSEAVEMLERADEKLSTARLLLEKEKYEDAVSRAYYAMFHAARALLVTEDSRPKTHSGVASELGQLFRDRMDAELISRFSSIQQLREDADYGLEADVDEGRAEEVIETAARFLEQARKVVSDG